MDIPPNLLREVREGNTVLLLGAGASMGATDSHDQGPPDGRNLARAIAKEFLGGAHKDNSLSYVAELAISESSLIKVQSFIQTIFDDLRPAPFHALLPTFKWHGLATTNYDLVIERAYQASKKPSQSIVPMIKNGDQVDQKLRYANSILYLKLHGCITHIDDESVPLILSVDQYILHRNGRDRVFDHLKNWGFEHPIVFIGHSLFDPDIRQLLLELGGSDVRPRYYTVTTSFTEEEKRLWENKRITTIAGSFEEFLQELDSQISSPFRGIAIPSTPSDLPISRKFATPSPSLSENCVAFLTSDVEFIVKAMPTETISPQMFYHGRTATWSPIEQGLDVQRQLADTVLSDVVLAEDMTSAQECSLYVLKGYAGSGKSVLLHRVAYEAAVTYDKLCLFKNPQGQMSFEALSEISKVTQERIFLFIDKVSENVSEVMNIIRKCRANKFPITLIVAERTNEWNMFCSELNPYVSDDYEVGYLSEREIDELLKLLDKHGSLGTLKALNQEERRAAFVKRAGRQLLVALYEATLGKPFEDIIVDEYDQVKPDKAQLMYLAICVLNQFDVPVRAGIIARLFGIRFTDFKENFFLPLEQVVYARNDSRTRDYVYTARHPHIAQIVFDRKLAIPDRRLDMCIRVLNGLNIDYSADRLAYRRLTRARTLLDYFPDHGMVEAIHETAQRIAGDDPYFYHQKGIYEMNRDNGNLSKASELLARAHSLARSDRTVIHSMAELELKKAALAKTKLEFESCLGQVRKLARQLIDFGDTESYPYHTLAKTSILKLKGILADSSGDFNELEFGQSIMDAEQTIQEGLQRFPDDAYLLESESSLSVLITDEDRAISALTKAFDSNPSNAYVAVRLAKYQVQSGLTDDALRVYRRAIDANPGNKNLHYHYAMTLMLEERSYPTEIEYHLRRAFTDGDHNYFAQFWYARQLYLNNKIPESVARFRTLRESPMDLSVKREIRAIIKDANGPKSFGGRVNKIESSHCWITRDGTSDAIFLYSKNVSGDIWKQLKFNTRLRFNIGFTFYGASAVDVDFETMPIL